MDYDVFDISDDPKWWSSDVDLIIWDHEGNEHYFEIKADWSLHKTGNAVLEMTSKTGEPGWFVTSRASHFVFVDMFNKNGYVARADDLKQYIKTGNYYKTELNGCDCLLIKVDNGLLFQKLHL